MLMVLMAGAALRPPVVRGGGAARAALKDCATMRVSPYTLRAGISNLKMAEQTA